MVWRDASWLFYCFQAVMPGYLASDVHCLPSGNEDQSVNLVLKTAAEVAATAPAPPSVATAMEPSPVVNDASPDPNMQPYERVKLPKDYKIKIDRHLVDVLKDPDSRKVEFLRTPKGSLVCGTINAKNSYGGYTGKKLFTAYFSETGEVIFLDYDAEESRLLGKPVAPSGTGYRFYRLLSDCGFTN